jgi:hypothetical protein
MLVPVTRSALIERVSRATARVLRARVCPVETPDIILCGLPAHRPPYESAAAACMRTKVPVTTLRRHFQGLLVPNEHADGAAPPELRTYLCWILLLSALEERATGKSWDEIAEHWYTTAARLRRLSQELLGVPLDTIDAEEIVLPAHAFEENFLPWLGVKLVWGVAV